MTKLGLLLGATTMLTSVTGAMAASTTTTSLHLTSFCDVLNFTVNAPYVGMVENATSCTADIMGGFASVKIKKLTGKYAFVGGPRFNSGTNAWGWLVTYPFKTGGTAYLYESTNGVSYNLCCSSTFTVNGARRATKGLLPPAGTVKDNNSNADVPKSLKF